MKKTSVAVGFLFAFVILASGSYAADFDYADNPLTDAAPTSIKWVYYSRAMEQGEYLFAAQIASEHFQDSKRYIFRSYYEAVGGFQFHEAAEIARFYLKNQSLVLDAYDFAKMKGEFLIASFIAADFLEDKRLEQKAMQKEFEQAVKDGKFHYAAFIGRHYFNDKQMVVEAYTKALKAREYETAAQIAREMIFRKQ